jgi:hypothetical protein
MLASGRRLRRPFWQANRRLGPQATGTAPKVILEYAPGRHPVGRAVPVAQCTRRDITVSALAMTIEP